MTSECVKIVTNIMWTTPTISYILQSPRDITVTNTKNIKYTHLLIVTMARRWSIR